MPQPRPASSAIVTRGDRMLLVRRKNPPSADMFAFPGGKAEPGERPEDAALRELLEETGIEARNPQLFATYDLKPETASGAASSHYFLSVFLVEADHTAEAVANDDAADPGWYTVEEVRDLPVPPSVLECCERVAKQLHSLQNRGMKPQ
ncbi:NUDIX hydrolase [Rhizobium sp. CG4]|jgi:8-oxo-dGTP diphosphatase|uniref:NUDIX hydrolase n=1 Tax=Rhizobium/Agrobacterium group TaxID=227290 RepID=UPI0017837773|nr:MULTISPECIES: NUDIX hydrolase [Rhizobium/Agrobacterium group]MBD9386455.1 NUDIX hydrolase [Agrobacterium sp. AGB01]MCM2455469.1 NUDIX hydrolase [Rhizobium sp. CG4]